MSSKQLFAVQPDLTLWRDVAVEGMAGDTEFDAQFGHLGVGLAHSGLGKTQLGGRHLERPSAVPTPRARGGKTGAGTASSVAPARCGVLIDMVEIDADRDQRIALKVVDLAAVRLGYPRITDLRCHIYVRLRDEAALPVDRYNCR